MFLVAGEHMLEDKVVIVTGAGAGIGRAHALELASHGAIVVVNDVGDSRHDVVAEIEAAGGRAAADHTSVSDWDGVEALVAWTAAEFGRLDGVVNNAGILRDGMLTGATEADWDAVIAVHLKGTFALIRHACAHWRARAKAGDQVSGRVVNTTSGTGLFGNIGQTNYGAAKAGIANLTMIAAMEMERYGVTVNAVSPIARTAMTEGLPWIERDNDDEWDEYEPGNSSPVVAWLLSDAAHWLTGAVLRIEGSKVLRVQPWQVDETVAYTSRSGQMLEAAELDLGMRRAYRLAPDGRTRSS